MKYEPVSWTFERHGSFYNYLPRGCQICRLGASLVLFVTGLCDRSCSYCPLSLERRGKDRIFANERAVSKRSEILDEARMIDALGTGITGGEPLLKLDLVLELIQLLKGELGCDHHIHLYTGTIPSRTVLEKLRYAGLDEIRIHPPSPAGLEEALREAIQLGLEAGVEIPAIAPAGRIVEAVRRSGAFLNLNELEFSETNREALEAAGFLPHPNHCGAIGSRALARREFALDDVLVHFCSSRFKDAVQLRERFKRRARKAAKRYEEATEDGTLLRGAIEGEIEKALELLRELGVPEEMFTGAAGRLEIAPWIAEELATQLKDLGAATYIEEVYPLEKRPVVERIPL